MLYRFLVFILLLVTPVWLAGNDSSSPSENTVTPVIHTTPEHSSDIKMPSIQEEEPPPDRFFMELVNMAFSLTFIIVILLIITWFVKKMLSNRMQQLNTHSGIKIIEKRHLTAKSVIYVLDIYGKGVAVAESTNGVVSLGTLPLPEDLSEKSEIEEKK